MRALFSSSSPFLFSLPARNPLLFLLLLRRIPSPSIPPLPHLPPLLALSLHGLAPPPSAPPPSRILQSDLNPSRASEVDNGDDDDGDDPMDEFLSRFVWAIRGNLADAFPGLPRETLDGMLLVICQKVIARLDGGSSASADGDSPLDLSEDLWRTIWEVSNSVHEAMRRDLLKRIGELFPGPSKATRSYLHAERDVERVLNKFGWRVGIGVSSLRSSTSPSSSRLCPQDRREREGGGK